MNIVRGSIIKVERGDKGFEAEVVGSWYDVNGHHHLGLKYLRLTGYKRNPDSTWRGKNLYPLVVKHVEGPEHAQRVQEKSEAKHADLFLCAKQAERERVEAANKAFNDSLNETKRARSKELEEMGGAGTTLQVVGFKVTLSHTDRVEWFDNQFDAVKCALRNLCKDYCNYTVVTFEEIQIVDNAIVTFVGNNHFIEPCLVDKVVEVARCVFSK